MKSSIIFLILAAFGLGIWGWSVTRSETQPDSVILDAQNKDYKNAEYGIAFSYPAGYVLSEQEVGNGERWHYNITLIHQSELPLRQNSEGPPTLSIDLYQNDIDNLSLTEWLTGNSLSNFKFGDETYTSTGVGGTDAVAYSWSGLYEGRTVAFLHRKAVVAVTGTYLTTEDKIYKDFSVLIKSFELN